MKLAPALAALTLSCLAAAACGDGGSPVVVSGWTLGQGHYVSDREVRVRGGLRVLAATADFDDPSCGVRASDLEARLSGGTGSAEVHLLDGGPDGDCFVALEVVMREADGVDARLELLYRGEVLPEGDLDGRGTVARADIGFRAPAEVALNVNGMPGFAVLEGLDSSIDAFVVDAEGRYLQGAAVQVDAPTGTDVYDWPCESPDYVPTFEGVCEARAVFVGAGAVAHGDAVIASSEGLGYEGSATVVSVSDLVGLRFFSVQPLTQDFPGSPALAWGEPLSDGPHSAADHPRIVAAPVLADGTPVWTGMYSVDVRGDASASVIGSFISLATGAGPLLIFAVEAAADGTSMITAEYGGHVATLALTP